MANEKNKVVAFDIKKYLAEPEKWRVFNGYDEELVALFCNEKPASPEDYVLSGIRKFVNNDGLIEYNTETYNIGGHYYIDRMDLDYKKRSLKYMIRIEAAKPEPLPVFNHNLNFYNVYYNVKSKKSNVFYATPYYC